MAKKLIVANWKMNGNIEKVIHDLTIYHNNSNTSTANVIIALPALYLHQALSIGGRFKIASQDVSQFSGCGAYTGEISSKMLRELQVTHSIIGHSERRINLNETDSVLAKKLENVINAGITPIFCIGEEYLVRESDKYHEFLLYQLKLLSQININTNELIIAYEPIWAIGTGKIPTLPEIAEIVNLIYSFVQKNLPRAKISVLYGGSVTVKNIIDILQIADIAGVLVGGASLKVDEFAAICTYA